MFGRDVFVMLTEEPQVVADVVTVCHGKLFQLRTGHWTLSV